LNLRGRTAATDESTTIVPLPRRRMASPNASRAVTCPVKFVSIIVAASRTSRCASSCGIRTPVAAITRSGTPPAPISSANAWWAPVSIAS
jgi:hypothetical protein